MRGPKPVPIPSGSEVKAPAPPTDLKDPEARKEWRRIAALLARRRTLTEEDQAALVMYCTSFATYKQAQTEIERDGSVVLSNTGVPVKNPWTTIQKQAFDRLKPLISELGLSPTSRARMKLEPDGPADDKSDFF